MNLHRSKLHESVANWEVPATPRVALKQIDIPDLGPILKRGREWVQWLNAGELELRLVGGFQELHQNIETWKYIQSRLDELIARAFEEIPLPQIPAPYFDCNGLKLNTIVFTSNCGFTMDFDLKKEFATGVNEDLASEVLVVRFSMPSLEVMERVWYAK
jgi:hypothetical protein